MTPDRVEDVIRSYSRREKFYWGDFSSVGIRAARLYSGQ